MDTDFRVYLFEEVETYLKEISEFAPFGIQVKGDSFKSVSYYDESNGDAEVNSYDALAKLKETFSKEIIDQLIDKAYIAVNTSITSNNKKLNAVMVLHSGDGKYWEENYYPYIMIDGKFEKWGVE